jgi:hypothetical protein
MIIEKVDDGKKFPRCRECEHRSRQLGTIRKSVKTGESHLVPYVICDVVGEMVFDGDPCPLDDEDD